jgi:hypothetical protein
VENHIEPKTAGQWVQYISTATGPRPCYTPIRDGLTLVPYLVRLDPSMLAPTYLGYLTANHGLVGELESSRRPKIRASPPSRS